jgi:hypothetical protein
LAVCVESVASLVVVGTEIVERFVPGEHVPDRDQDRVSNRDRSALTTDTSRKPRATSSEVGPFDRDDALTASTRTVRSHGDPGLVGPCEVRTTRASAAPPSW